MSIEAIANEFDRLEREIIKYKRLSEKHKVEAEHWKTKFFTLTNEIQEYLDQQRRGHEA